MSERDINDIRREIDGLDRQIVELVNSRYRLVEEVGQWKHKNASAIFVPEREKALLQRLESYNKGPLENMTLRAIYREIMSGALALEHPMRVAYLGPENTFSNLAALRKFGHSVAYMPKGSIAEVFEDVERGRADYGVVPIENSTEGAVTYTLDMFVNSDARICSEILLPAHQNLMARCPKAQIRVIYSHPQALAQCRLYLHRNFQNVVQIETRSTAEAARRAAEEEGAAAIASSIAADAYQLDVLEANVEDNARNVTRFLVIGRQDPQPTGDDKSSIVFAVNDKVGALYECLSYFAKEGVNMTMIESRPAKTGGGEYFFFVDLLGHVVEDKPAGLIKHLRQSCPLVKILGSYPRIPFNAE